MMYALAVILILAVTFLLVRVRFRLQLSPERRIMFVGLGRTGPEIDFVRREGQVRLFGLRLVRFDLDRTTRKPDGKAAPKRENEKKSPATKRRYSVSSMLTTLPQGLSAFWRFGLGLLMSTIVEEAEAEIEAGFDTPDVTGQAYGYYQAALAAAPGLVGRVRFVPNWTERTFSGSARLSLAWPVYRLLWQTVLLAWRLPKRKIYRLAIGEKKGVRDVEQ